MSFGLRRRFRDGGGTHRGEPQPVVPPFDHPYRPVPHLFVAHQAVAHETVAQQPVAPPAATLPEQPPEVPTEQARPEQTRPDQRSVEPAPVPVPAPRSGMRPAEALAELSALSRG
jgi:hypothetical protein